MESLIEAAVDRDLGVRVLFWERAKYARALGEYLRESERRFHHPDEVDLPVSVLHTVRGRRGSFFELRMDSVCPERVSDLLKAGPTFDGVEFTLEVSDGPILVCLRKAEPRDRTSPYRGFQPVLRLFPTDRRRRRDRLVAP